MKYVIFFAVLVAGVPLLAVVASSSVQLRRWALTVLVFLSALGARVSINFVSMETYRGPDRGFEVTLADLNALALLPTALLGRPVGGSAAVAAAVGRKDRLASTAAARFIAPNTLLMLAYFVCAAISAMTGDSLLISGFSVWKLLRLGLLYLVLYRLLSDEEDFFAVWRGLVAVGMYVGWMAFYQKYGMGLYRVHGPFDHSNTIPLYANLVMPWLLASSLLWGRLSLWQSMIGVAASLGLVFAVAATMSRAGLALAVSALVSVLIFCAWRQPSGRVTAVGCLVGILMIIGGAMAIDSIIDRFQNAPESSEAARDEFNVAAEMMAQDHRFGVGINCFSLALTNTEKYNEHIEVMKTEEQAGVAHHIYLLTAAEMGQIGLVVFVLMIGRWMVIALWTALRHRSLCGSMALALAIGMGTLHVSGFLEWALRITPVSYQYVLVVAMVAALSRATAPAARRGR